MFEPARISEDQYKRILKIYYFITPVFVLLDYVAGVKIRIVFPAGFDGFALVYYIICFGSVFVAFKQTMVAAIFSLLESSINLLLLLLSVFLPLVMLDQTLEGVGGFRFGLTELIHFFIVGSFLLFGFYMNPIMFQNKP